MCVFTVVSLMKSSLPISAFERPRAIRRNTSAHAPSNPRAGSEARAGECANRSITRFVTAGERSASPAAMVRIAASSCSGGSSFSTKPLAPALSAS